MLASNTIRFATDTFGAATVFKEELIPTQDDPTPTPDPDAPDDPTPDEQQTFMKQALLISKVPLDCSKKSAVDNFVITGSEPTGSSRRVVFLIDDAYWIVKNNNLVAWNREPTFENVIHYGNRISVLNEQSNITGFVGKKIYPIIALQAPSDADDFPTIKIGLATRNTNELLTDTQDSPVYELGSTQTITSITAQTNLTGAGEVAITVRLRQEGSWTSYMTFANAADKDANAVQFRMKYTVTTTDGTDSAQVQAITVKSTSGVALVTGNVANFYSVVADYEHDLKHAYCVVRHDPLIDAAIEAYVSFRPTPKRRELLQIGTASGSQQELTLGDPDPNIIADSIKIFVNGNPLYDFDFNTETSTVILTATKNAVITASYDYDTGQETWQRMTADDSQPYNDEDGTYSTRFTFTNEQDGLTVATVRIRLRRLSGSQSGKIGTATGKTQLFTLKHKPVPSSIAFAEDVKFSYDEQNGILSCVAAKNTALNISYDWLGDAPVVYSFAAGFAVA